MRPFVLLFAALLLPGAALHAQKKQTYLVVDHTARTMRVVETSDSAAFATVEGDSVREGEAERARGPVNVRVINSNSALFTCTVEKEEAKAADLSAITGFLTGMKGYLLELAREIDQEKDRFGYLEVDPLKGRRDKLRAALESYTDAVVGDSGVQAAYVMSLVALEQVRGSVALDTMKLVSFKRAVRPLCDSACRKLKVTAVLPALLDTVRMTTNAFRKAIGPTPHRIDRELLERALATITSGDEVVALAYTAETIVARLYNARNHYACKSVPVGKFKAYEASVTVAPSAIPAIQRVAPAPPFKSTVELQPDNVLRFSLGLAALRAGDASYPVYGTTARADSFDITIKDSTDYRWNYGLVLSVTARGLDQRDRSPGFALYPVELTLNPADPKAVGLGAAFSFWHIKIGRGKVWTKHTALAGQVVGQTLADAAQLSTKDSYGSGRWYWSVSIVGVPPFLP